MTKEVANKKVSKVRSRIKKGGSISAKDVKYLVENDPKKGLRGLNLRKTDFRGTILQGIDFSGSDLTRSNFHGCDLSGSIFTNSVLDNVDMRETNQTNVVYKNTSMKGTDLRWSEHDGSKLKDVSFDSRTQLQQADLRKCKISDRVNFSKAKTTGAKFPKSFKGKI